MNEEQDTGWCLIPPQIIGDESLSPNEKLIFGRILGLTKKEGYCWASNLWLGQQIGIAPMTVSHIVNSLKEKGLLEVEITRKDKKIVQRHIFVRSLPQSDRSSIRDRIDPLSAIGQGSVEDRVENSEDSEPSDKIEEKLKLQKEKHAKKSRSLIGSPFQSFPQFPEKKPRKYFDATGIV